jgi:hypothetical protein
MKGVHFKKASKYINGRKPFRKDPSIDYEIDSEDELQEMFAENIGGDSMEEEVSQPSAESVSDFIVDDGY